LLSPNYEDPGQWDWLISHAPAGGRPCLVTARRVGVPNQTRTVHSRERTQVIMGGPARSRWPGGIITSDNTFQSYWRL
jgi:hypothetical protein